MSDTHVARESAAVMIRGRFNPAIFSPRWFLDEQLVGSIEYDAAEIEVISPSVTAFQMAWAQFRVSDDALQILTEDPDEFERVRDLAVGILAALRHTPLMALGLNRGFHAHVRDYDWLNRIGDAITPKSVWEPPLRFAGMRSVTMWGARDDLFGGRVSVQVEPSTQIPMAIFVSQNDHYDLTETDAPPSTRMSAFDDVEPLLTADKIPVALSILNDKWSGSMLSAEQVLKMIHDLGDA